jgi:hypothetical protein
MLLFCVLNVLGYAAFVYVGVVFFCTYVSRRMCRSLSCITQDNTRYEHLREWHTQWDMKTAAIYKIGRKSSLYNLTTSESK